MAHLNHLNRQQFRQRSSLIWSEKITKLPEIGHHIDQLGHHIDGIWLYWHYIGSVLALDSWQLKETIHSLTICRWKMSSFLDMIVKEHQRAMFFVSKPLFIQYHGKKCDNPQISMRQIALGHGVPKTPFKPAPSWSRDQMMSILTLPKKKESEYPLVN